MLLPFSNSLFLKKQLYFLQNNKSKAFLYTTIILQKNKSKFGKNLVFANSTKKIKIKKTLSVLVLQREIRKRNLKKFKLLEHKKHLKEKKSFSKNNINNNNINLQKQSISTSIENVQNNFYSNNKPSSNSPRALKRRRNRLNKRIKKNAMLLINKVDSQISVDSKQPQKSTFLKNNQINLSMQKFSLPNKNSKIINTKGILINKPSNKHTQYNKYQKNYNKSNDTLRINILPKKKISFLKLRIIDIENLFFKGEDISFYKKKLTIKSNIRRFNKYISIFNKQFRFISQNNKLKLLFFTKLYKKCFIEYSILLKFFKRLNKLQFFGLWGTLKYILKVYKTNLRKLYYYKTKTSVITKYYQGIKYFNKELKYLCVNKKSGSSKRMVFRKKNNKDIVLKKLSTRYFNLYNSWKHVYIYRPSTFFSGNFLKIHPLGLLYKNFLLTSKFFKKKSNFYFLQYFVCLLRGLYDFFLDAFNAFEFLVSKDSMDATKIVKFKNFYKSFHNFLSNRMVKNPSIFFFFKIFTNFLKVFSNTVKKNSLNYYLVIFFKFLKKLKRGVNKLSLKKLVTNLYILFPKLCFHSMNHFTKRYSQFLVVIDKKKDIIFSRYVRRLQNNKTTKKIKNILLRRYNINFSNPLSSYNFTAAQKYHINYQKYLNKRIFKKLRKYFAAEQLHLTIYPRRTTPSISTYASALTFYNTPLKGFVDYKGILKLFLNKIPKTKSFKHIRLNIKYVLGKIYSYDLSSYYKDFYKIKRFQTQPHLDNIARVFLQQYQPSVNFISYKYKLFVTKHKIFNLVSLLLRNDNKNYLISYKNFLKNLNKVSLYFSKYVNTWKDWSFSIKYLYFNLLLLITKMRDNIINLNMRLNNTNSFVSLNTILSSATISTQISSRKKLRLKNYVSSTFQKFSAKIPNLFIKKKKLKVFSTNFLKKSIIKCVNFVKKNSKNKIFNKPHIITARLFKQKKISKTFNKMFTFKPFIYIYRKALISFKIIRYLKNFIKHRTNTFSNIINFSFLLYFIQKKRGFNLRHRKKPFKQIIFINNKDKKYKMVSKNIISINNKNNKKELSSNIKVKESDNTTTVALPLYYNTYNSNIITSLILLSARSFLAKLKSKNILNKFELQINNFCNKPSSDLKVIKPLKYIHLDHTTILNPLFHFRFKSIWIYKRLLKHFFTATASQNYQSIFREYRKEFKETKPLLYSQLKFTYNKTILSISSDKNFDLLEQQRKLYLARQMRFHYSELFKKKKENIKVKASLDLLKYRDLFKLGAFTKKIEKIDFEAWKQWYSYLVEDSMYIPKDPTLYYIGGSLEKRAFFKFQRFLRKKRRKLYYEFYNPFQFKSAIEQEIKTWRLYFTKFKKWYSLLRNLYTTNLSTFHNWFLLVNTYKQKKSIISVILNSLVSKNMETKLGNNIKFYFYQILLYTFWMRRSLFYKYKLYHTPLYFDSIYNSIYIQKKIPWRSENIWGLWRRSLTITQKYEDDVIVTKKRTRLNSSTRTRKGTNNKKHKLTFIKKSNLNSFEKINSKLDTFNTFIEFYQRKNSIQKVIDYSHERFHKFRLYYSTLGYRQFQQLFLKLRYYHKNSIGSLIGFLEFRLEFFLYRINFVPSKYFAKQLLQKRAFAINNRSMVNKNYLMSINDVLTVNRFFFSTIYENILTRFRIFRQSALKYSSNTTPILFDNPSYTEIDYSLLLVHIIRKPKPSEVFVPNGIELDSHSRDLSRIYNSYL